MPYAGVVNGSLWTMPLEVALYVLVPLVLCAGEPPALAQACLPAHGPFLRGCTWWRRCCACAVSPQWRMVIYGLDVAQFLVLGVYYMLGMLYALPRYGGF